MGNSVEIKNKNNENKKNTLEIVFSLYKLKIIPIANNNNIKLNGFKIYQIIFDKKNVICITYS